MQKFTVFTVILSIVVIIAVADLVVNNYLPGLDSASISSEIANSELTLPDSIDTSKAMQTSVIGSDELAGDAVGENETTDQTYRLGFDLQKNGSTVNDPETIETPVSRTTPTVEDLIPATTVMTDLKSAVTDATSAITDTTSAITDAASKKLADIEETTPIPRVTPVTPTTTDSFDLKPAGPALPAILATATPTTTTSKDFEDSNFVAFTTNAVLRDEQIKSAGFVGAYLQDEAYDGSLYKTIYTSDLYDVTVKKTTIATKDALLAKIYVIKIGPNSNIDDVYKVLKVRGAEGLDSEINETNGFGSGSFYMNDARRQNTAFLTVKIGSSIYGFSYPKEYHLQIANLIKLLEWEVK
jgi:hypothetical protein